MGDDFDLFPKRESLDPFSFGTKDKGKEESSDEVDPADFLFDESENRPPRGPGAPEEEGKGRQKILPDETASPAEKPQSDSGLDPFGDMTDKESDEIFGEPASRERDREPALEGPIPDDQSGYGPRPTGQGAVENKDTDKRKPSPFVVIGGALVLILALLWGALTYLQKERKVVVPASIPPASARIEVPRTPADPAAEPAASDEVESASPVTGAAAPKQPVVTPPPSQPTEPETAGDAAPVKMAPVAGTPPVKQAEISPPKSQSGDYSVQVGAFILKTSVRDLEKKLAAAGLEPLFKEGSTQAMMHFLTVGPFENYMKATDVVSDLDRAGIDSTPQRVSGGGGLVHAGSYLLEENAREVMTRIRSFGYPVRLTKKETQLPMTFVRVGQFSSRDEASRSRDELRNKGFDAIVVKLQ